MRAVLLSIAAFAIPFLCSGETKHTEEPTPTIPEFPYEKYLIQDNDTTANFPTIGDDGDGFAAISDKTRYPVIPATISTDAFIDSLVQCYNIALAYNAIEYDVGTAFRYMEDSLNVYYGKALLSPKLDGIKSEKIKALLREMAQTAVRNINEGVDPESSENKAAGELIEYINNNISQIIKGHFTDTENAGFDPSTVVTDYEELHNEVINDAENAVDKLLAMTLNETDFAKKCIYAREYIYADFIAHKYDEKNIVTIIDQILRADEYSPLLGDLWLIWRLKLQLLIFSGYSNDSAMYNMFYNDMKNRVVATYLSHIKDDPNDVVAFSELLSLIYGSNIVRNSGVLFGNNAMLDERNLLFHLTMPDTEDDASEE